MKKSKKMINLIMIILIILVLGLSFWYVKNTFFNETIFIFQDNNIELKIGNSYTINYELNKQINVTWESENPNVATVNNGVVVAVNLGNTTIKGTVTSGETVITQTCYVTTYSGDKGVSLNDILISGSVLYITEGDSYQLPYSYIPSNAYIKTIDYAVTDPSIVSFDGVVSAKKVGTTDISVIINKTVTKTIKVSVISKIISPVLSEMINDVTIPENDIVLRPGDTREINYTISPTDAFIENVKWSSDNPTIVSVENGVIKANKSGNAVITLSVNNISKTINVSVTVPVTGLSLLSSPKLVMKVGNSETIKTSVSPSNATNKKLIYSTSNPNSMRFDANGIGTALVASSGIITVRTEDGNYKVEIPYIINPRTGVVNSDGGIWGYSSVRDKVPVIADVNFFRNLASSGKGVLSGNTYIYSNGNKTYKYDISRSVLSVDGKDTLMRIYYPQGVDLSSVNTFTFMGGTGEENLRGYFYHLDQNREEMKSSGIIILVSTKDHYHGYDATNSTEFVKSIVGQKQGMKNRVGVYSKSGQAAKEASLSGLYDRIIIVNSYTNNPNEYKNIDVVIFSPVGDSMFENTRKTLVGFATSNYGHVTVISNNSVLYNNSDFNSKFLMINPGNQMGSGHGFVNISKAKVFSYACS